MGATTVSSMDGHIWRCTGRSIFSLLGLYAAHTVGCVSFAAKCFWQRPSLLFQTFQAASPSLETRRRVVFGIYLILYVAARKNAVPSSTTVGRDEQLLCYSPERAVQV